MLVQEMLRVLKPEAFILIDVVTGFQKDAVYRYDVGSLSGLHKLFGASFVADLFSEKIAPGERHNPHGNTVIRTLFSIRKGD